MGLILTKLKTKIIEYFQMHALGFCFGKTRSRIGAPMSTKPANADLRERLWRARRLIDECYDRPLDLTEISREACLSRYHFLRSFRDTFETTPHQYLIKKRI